MHQSDDIKKNIIHRLRIARGHLNKVLEMIENGDYCIDIIHQSRAVQNALKEADSITLDNHLRTCVINSIKKSDSEKTIEEIIKVFKNNSK